MTTWVKVIPQGKRFSVVCSDGTPVGPRMEKGIQMPQGDNDGLTKEQALARATVLDKWIDRTELQHSPKAYENRKKLAALQGSRK